MPVRTGSNLSTMNTKKILLYGGGALVLGAFGFFVWSFFQKVDLPVAQTTPPLVDENTSNEEDETPTNSGNNPFTAMLDTTFPPIKTPNTQQSASEWLNSLISIKP